MGRDEDNSHRAFFCLKECAGKECARGYFSLSGPLDRRLAGLTSSLEHTSLDLTRVYSQPTIGQFSIRVEQVPLNAYAK
jgi:hypothetical protein